MNKSLAVDGENYVKWRKNAKIHVKGWENKSLIEDPPNLMTNELERDDTQLLCRC